MAEPVLYTVQLLRDFKTDTHIYRKGSWQYAWIDTVGYAWLRGKHTGWEFCSCAHPGVDFSFGRQGPVEGVTLLGGFTVPSAPPRPSQRRCG